MDYFTTVGSCRSIYFINDHCLERETKYSVKDILMK